MELMTTNEVAEFLRIKAQTLVKLRKEGIGPQFYKISGVIRYDKKDIIRWIEAGKVSSNTK